MFKDVNASWNILFPFNLNDVAVIFDKSNTPLSEKYKFDFSN